VEDLLAQMDLSPGDVEAVFVNGLVRPVDTVLTDGDRVALVPPGSPGPYRLLLGMVGKNKN
jgi:sulfur carrier protein ThiS